MRWNELTIERNYPIIDGVEDRDYACYVHLYASAVADHTVASCDYAFKFGAIATNEEGNVMETQFHPKERGDRPPYPTKFRPVCPYLQQDSDDG